MSHVQINLYPRINVPADVPLTPSQEKTMQDMQRGKFYAKRRAIENKLADRELEKQLRDPYDEI